MGLIIMVQPKGEKKGTRDPHEPLWRQAQVPPVPNRWKLSRERHGVC